MITNIVDYLFTKTDITNLIWTRIYYWLPSSDQTSNYITINQITENRPFDLQVITRLEFRFIWWDTTATYSTLENLEQIVQTHILNYTWSDVYKILVSNKYNWYDEKSRKILVRDYLFYNTN